MKYAKRVTRMFAWFCSLLMLFGCLAVFPAAADTGSVYADLNLTDVKKDLQDLGFDLTKYPIDETIETTDVDRFLVMLQVLEFGYEYRKRDFSDYGLFLYLYNPSGKALSGSPRNSVELAVKTASGEMSDYSKKGLLLISASEDHRFYKYRVTGMTPTLLRSMNRDRREYNISGVEILFDGETNPKDFKIGGVFQFSGYQQGYGFNRESADSVYCSYNKLETLELELHPASWRSEYQNENGAGHHDEISSVYFAIPNWYFKQYGNSKDPKKGLYSVRVSYNEGFTNGIVSDNKDMIDYLQERNDSQIQPFIWGDDFSAVLGSYKQSGYALYSRYSINTVSTWKEKVYGMPGYPSAEFTVHVDSFLPRVGMSIYSKTNDSVSSELFFGQLESSYAPRKYIYSEGNSGQLRTTYPQGRTMGYHEETLTRDDLLDITDTSAWVGSASKFEKWWYSLWHNDFLDKVQTQQIDMIQTVDCSDVDDIVWFKNSVSAEKYHISEADIPAFNRFVLRQEVNPINWTNGAFGSTVVLLHFAVTDCYLANVSCFKGGFDGKTAVESYSGNHYYFEKSYFKDFDVISLTFMDEDSKMVTLPVIADPVDVGGSLPSPSEGAGGSTTSPGGGKDSWWDRFMTFFGNLRGALQAVVIIVGILVLCFLLKVLSPILAPLIRLFGKLFGSIVSLFGNLGRTVSNVINFADDRYVAHRRRKTDRQQDEDRLFNNSEKRYDADRKRVKDSQSDEDRIFGNQEKRYDAKRKRVKDKQADADRSRKQAREGVQDIRDERRWTTERGDLEVRDVKNRRFLQADRKSKNKQQGSFETDEFMQASLRKTYGKDLADNAMKQMKDGDKS